MMRCLHTSLPMLILQIWLFLYYPLSAQLVAQSSGNPARALDALLQGYAYKVLIHPRTGIPYDGLVPENLSGITIAALRLRCGSLRTRGVKVYKEFEIPTGVIVQPYVKRLVLVYQNLGNWSEEYYNPLPGYNYLAPVLGLLAYNASNLSAGNFPELDIWASTNPILIHFDNVGPVPDGMAAKCVWFDLQGSTNFSEVSRGGKTCSTNGQGHYSIVVESIAPSLSPGGGGGGERKSKSKSRVWVIVGSMLGGVLALVLLGMLLVWAHKYKQRKKIREMETAAQAGESLHMTAIGDTKAPLATVTRTQPTIETEYVP